MIRFLIVMACLPPAISHAQRPREKQDIWSVKTHPPAALSFSNVVVAKVSDDKAQLMVLSPAYETGGDMAIKVTMNRMTVPVHDIRAWRLDGHPLTSKSIISKFASPLHALMIEADATMQFDGIDPYFTRILRDDLMILYLPKGLAKLRQEPRGSSETPTKWKPISVPPESVQFLNLSISHKLVITKAGDEQQLMLSIPMYSVSSAQGAEQVSIDHIKASLSGLRAWDLSGQSLGSSSLAKQLARDQHLFAIEMPRWSHFAGLDPFYSSILRPGLVVLFLPPGTTRRSMGQVDVTASPLTASEIVERQRIEEFWKRLRGLRNDVISKLDARDRRLDSVRARRKYREALIAELTAVANSAPADLRGECWSLRNWIRERADITETMEALSEEVDFNRSTEEKLRRDAIRFEAYKATNELNKSRRTIDQGIDNKRKTLASQYQVDLDVLDWDSW